MITGVKQTDGLSWLIALNNLVVFMMANIIKQPDRFLAVQPTAQ